MSCKSPVRFVRNKSSRLQTPADICDLKTVLWPCRHTTDTCSAKKNACIKNKKKYDLIQMWGLKVEDWLMIKSIEEMIFILLAQDNVSSRGLLWNASFKRLRKRWLGVRKETDNDQVQRIIRNKENFILKGVFHSKRLVNQDWISLLI